jgi:hypothetical protein
MNRELKLIKNNQTINFQFWGFKKKNKYGEIYVTLNNSKTFIFRGECVRSTMIKAKESYVTKKTKCFKNQYLKG